MDSDVLASLYAYIVRGGGSKDQCPYVTDDESGKAYDAIEGEVKAKSKADPNMVWEVPGEVPGRPGSSSADDGVVAPVNAPTDKPPAAAPDPEEEPPPADAGADPAVTDGKPETKAAVPGEPADAEAPEGEAAPKPTSEARADPNAINGEGRFFVIQDPGDPRPWALVAVRPRGLYEMWTGTEWVDMPYFAAYFVGGEIGARETYPANVEQWKQTIPAPPPGAVAMLRGDGKGVAPEKPAPEPDDAEGGNAATEPASDLEREADAATPDAPDEEQDPPTGGKPKKGVNPFPPKKD